MFLALTFVDFEVRYLKTVKPNTKYALKCCSSKKILQLIGYYGQLILKAGQLSKHNIVNKISGL